MTVKTWLTCIICLAIPSAPSRAQDLFTNITEGAVGRLLSGQVSAGGIAFTDYNNDGLPDLFLAAFGAPAFRLLENGGGSHFADVTSVLRPSIPRLMPRAMRGGGAAFADFDNDGDADLFVSSGHALSRAQDLLLRNDGGRFTDVASDAGLVEEAPTDNAIWLDYDRDGNLDLYLGHWLFPGFDVEDPTLRNKLQRNNGDGTFSDVTNAVGLDVQLHTTGGGSGHGMAAADFDNDDWPDLYVGVWQGSNRLFLSESGQAFRDATTATLADEGKVFGVAVGDIDQDGDIDIFQAGGGGGEDDPSVPSPSFLFANDGEGRFTNVAREAGLGALYDVLPTYLSENAITELFDVDNDGDLDLVIGSPFIRLFVNGGQGDFGEHLDGLGITTPGFFAVADHDGNGYQDLWIAGGGGGFGLVADPALYRTESTPQNHWLQLELVGIESNRDGVGARVRARAGDLELLRELRAGTGFTQSEMLIHLGLGPHASVDELEIQWPSGQLDSFQDIGAGQRIRVFEGREAFTRAAPSTWQADFPDAVRLGQTVVLKATVRPAVFEEGGRIDAVVADLTALGGLADLQLSVNADGSYGLDARFAAAGEPGDRPVRVIIRQMTTVGLHETVLTRIIPVLSDIREDFVLFSDAAPLADNLTADIGQFDFFSTAPVFEGQFALAIEAGQPPDEDEPAGFQLRIELDTPLPIEEFEALSFAFHPGELSPPPTGAPPSSDAPPPDIVVVLESTESRPSFIGLLEEGLVDLDEKAWQQVEIPLSELGLQDAIVSIGLFGFLQGRFFLDDIRLVTSGGGTASAVLEERSGEVTPADYSLGQNFPNPFNSRTVITYDLPYRGEVKLTVYNVTGQRVATLVQGPREPGTYRLSWDGRNDAGQVLSSGLYVYQLLARVPGRRETVRGDEEAAHASLSLAAVVRQRLEQPPKLESRLTR